MTHSLGSFENFKCETTPVMFSTRKWPADAHCAWEACLFRVPAVARCARFRNSESRGARDFSKWWAPLQGCLRACGVPPQGSLHGEALEICRDFVVLPVDSVLVSQ